MKLSEKERAELDKLKEAIDLNAYGATVKTALRVMKYLRSEADKGNRIFIRSPDGSQTELLL